MNHGHCKFCALHFHSLNSFRRLRGKIRKIRTFNEEKEAFWVSEQDAEGFDYHLHQGWVAVGSKLSVSLKLHVRVGEQTCAEIRVSKLDISHAWKAIYYWAGNMIYDEKSIKTTQNYSLS